MILLTLLLLITQPHSYFFFFFFNDTATTEIYTLSLHDALPILSWSEITMSCSPKRVGTSPSFAFQQLTYVSDDRSEEHTSELQSRLHLVCRLLLEKKQNEHSHRRVLTPSLPLLVTPCAEELPIEVIGRVL